MPNFLTEQTVSYNFPSLESLPEEMLDHLKSSDDFLVIFGDRRHDSMGHSAKYGAYTILCCNVPQIIHFSLVQVFTTHVLFRNLNFLSLNYT